MFPPTGCDEALEDVVVDPKDVAEFSADPFAVTEAEPPQTTGGVLQDEAYLARLLDRHKRIKNKKKEPTFKKQAIELGTYNDRIVEEAVRSGEYVPPDDEVREEELRCRLVDSTDESCNAAGPPPSLNSFLSAICSCMSSTIQRVARRYWQGY